LTKFYKDINHGSQHQDDYLSTESIRSNTGSRESKKSVSNKTESIRSNNGGNNSNSRNITEIRSQTSEEDHQEEESEDDHNLYQSFTEDQPEPEQHLWKR